MDILLQSILLIVGFIALIKGADWMVSGASSTALNFKVSKTLIGLTIVAFGTSAPEFAVSISSMISGNTDMLIGNVVGSNILNILLLIGIGVLVRPIIVKRATIRKELILLLALTVGFAFLSLDTVFSGATNSAITRIDALICLVFFAFFMGFIIHATYKNRKTKKKSAAEKPAFTLKKSILLTIVGLVGIIVGSQLVVNSATSIATAIGVSERIIALTIVAFGTSLPELVTTITAAKRNESELIIGNVIGSNIFNICIVLALPVLMFGDISPSGFSIVDLIVMILSVVLLYLMTLKDRKITRIEGALLLLVFTAYYGFVIYGAFA